MNLRRHGTKPPAWRVEEAKRDLLPLANTLMHCALCGTGGEHDEFHNGFYLPADVRLPRVAYALCIPCMKGFTAEDRQKLEAKFHADPAFCSFAMHGGHA